MTVTAQPRVTECSALSCAYNDHQGCHAVGITIDEADNCVTFFPTGVDGGLPSVIATVGACQRTDCVHNEHAVCTASEVRIGTGTDPAHCLTYQPG
jgi:hypothetical protein